MARKQGKKVDQNLMDRTNQFNQIFDNIQDLSYDYVKQIDIGIDDKFSKVFDKYNNQPYLPLDVATFESFVLVRWK